MAAILLATAKERQALLRQCGAAGSGLLRDRRAIDRDTIPGLPCLATHDEQGHHSIEPSWSVQADRSLAIKQPARKRRPRHPPPPAAVLSWPLWKRGLCMLLFVIGGGGAAAWGVYGVVAWIAAMHRGDGVIETENFILGFPLLGAALCALAPEFIAPRWVATWSETGGTRFAAIVLGSIAAGIVLVFLGQLVINVAMELDGYHACDVGGRGRVTDVIWARADVACRGRDTGR